MSIRDRLPSWLGGHRRRGSVTPTDVRWAYRLFLDREPRSSQSPAKKALLYADRRALRAAFLTSQEYADKNPDLTPLLTGNEPPLEIESVDAEADRDRLFAHVQETWQRLGEEEPHWSVITDEAFRAEHIEENRARFLASGAPSET